MKRPLQILAAGLGIALFGCQPDAEMQQAMEQAAGRPSNLRQESITAASWNSGLLSTAVVPLDKLQPISDAVSGSNIWKSNNPEIFKGNGWLMQNARTDSQRGGASYPLSGTFPVYLFHINQSNAQKYLHVLVTNPNATAVTLSGKGSMYTNAEKPLTGAGAGQSYNVSKDWLLNTPRTTFSGVSLGSFKAYEVAKLPMSHGNMIDGRFEITASAGVYVYTVVTSTGNLADAINLAQGAPAPGDIYTPNANAYGREAGVYAASVWSGTTNIELPASASHLGLALNTSGKFAFNGKYQQDQNAVAVSKLSDSAEKTYGNYGHRYDITLAMSNPHASAKTVKLYFASNFTSSTNSPSFTYSGMLLLNGAQKVIYTTPTAPKQLLATWTVNASSPFNARMSFYVPGLITTGQQLILEVQ